MAKAKTTPVVQEEQLITLTKEQFQSLLNVRELLDAATDTLDGIDGDENAFAIGKMVGDAHSDLIRAYNELADVIISKQDDAIDSDSDGDDKDTWTFA
jgi:hypothetical protein